MRAPTFSNYNSTFFGDSDHFLNRCFYVANQTQSRQVRTIADDMLRSTCFTQRRLHEHRNFTMEIANFYAAWYS